jgi:hypothetical protein
MKHSTALIATLFVIMLPSARGFAADGATNGQAGRNGPCKADVEKLCPNVVPGGGRIIACLKQNREKVSDSCKASLEKRRAKKAENANSDQ